MTPGTEDTSGEDRERESDIISVERQNIFTCYCELRIDLDRTRGDCGDKPELFW